MNNEVTKKRKIPKFAAFVFVCLLGVAALYSYLQHNKATVGKLPSLKNGDLVFQTQRSSQDLAIMYATGSLYSHMGIIKIPPDGEPHVIEAVGPVREVTLSRWIRQGIAGQLTIKRIRNLDPAIADKMISQAGKLFGKPYDIFFTFGDDKIYCSELIYDLLKGTGISLGKVQKVSELNMGNFAVEKLIEKRWQSYPPCKNLPNKNLEECKKVIMNQTLITPKSIAEDPKLETIYSNYTLKD
jgi:hypothetical protein